MNEHIIHVEHNGDTTVLTVDDFDLAARLSLVLVELDYSAIYSAVEDDKWSIEVVPHLDRNKLRKIIREQFNPETVIVDTYDKAS